MRKESLRLWGLFYFTENYKKVIILLVCKMYWFFVF